MFQPLRKQYLVAVMRVKLTVAAAAADALRDGPESLNPRVGAVCAGK